VGRWLDCPAVGETDKKPVIGILGGIGSGKSTVAAEFARLGCKIIDADEIVRELLDTDCVKDKITTLFGKAVLGAAERIDRRRLADIAFSDAARLSSLNEMVHPLVLKRSEELIAQYSRQNEVKAVVLDMPLLAEVGWDKRCDRLIFVDCRKELRLKRAKKSGVEEHQLKMREKFQISLDNKAKLADNTIDNNSDFSTLVRQVANIFSHIISR